MSLLKHMLSCLAMGSGNKQETARPTGTPGSRHGASCHTEVIRARGLGRTQTLLITKTKTETETQKHAVPSAHQTIYQMISRLEQAGPRVTENPVAAIELIAQDQLLLQVLHVFIPT